MREVVGTRSWIFWWAVLTSTVFLQEWLRRLADFFRDKNIFSPNGFPFGIVSGLNKWIDSSAEYIQNTVKFNPSQPITTAPFVIQNWVLALIVGVLILGIAAATYVRALSSPALADDILALLVLYFVIHIEAHLIAIARFSPLTPAGRALIDNPALTFWVLMFFLVLMVFLGEGLRNKRSFWRGVFEAILVALFLLPTESGSLIGFGIDRFADFGRIVQTNLIFGLIWGVVGILLAFTRLYHSDARAA